MTTSTTSSQWSATAAVETVRAGSAGLSATYYGMLGLVVPSVVVGDLSIPAAAIGLGLLAGATDYAKGNALATALGHGKIGLIRRVVAFSLFMVLFVASMIAGDGVLITLRTMMAAGPADVITKHDDVWGDLKSVKAKLETMAAVPTTMQVQESMNAAPVSRTAFKATSQCNDFTEWRADYRKGCKPILELRVTMATAIDKANLEERRDELQARADAMGPKPVSADPQASIISEVTGYSAASVVWFLVAVFGIALEGVACFGRYILDRPANRPAASRWRFGRRHGDVPAEQFAQTVKGSQPKPSIDALLAAIHPALLVNAAKGSVADTSANGSKRDGGAPVVAFPVIPKRPSAPNGSAAQREAFERRENVLAFLRDEATVGNVINRQAYIGETLGIPESSLSELLADMERAGEIVRRQDGRRKVIAVAQRALVTA